jgi:hypothetical protein
MTVNRAARALPLLFVAEHLTVVRPSLKRPPLSISGFR